MTMLLTKTVILLKLMAFIAVCKSDGVLPAGDGDLVINEESCEVICRNGDKPRQHKNVNVIEDRCGLDYDKPETRITDIIPDIRWCCRDRDLCYHSCSKTLQTCEENFTQCVREACRTEDCEKEAAEKFLSTSPCPSFIAAKKRACTCSAEGDKKSDTDDQAKKPKFKVVERGTKEHKLMYIMPEDADEEEYIRKNPLPSPPKGGMPKMAPSGQKKHFVQVRGDDVKESDTYDGDHDEL